MEKTFKHLAGDERRTAIEEALGDTEHKLKENLKTIKLLDEKIIIFVFRSVFGSQDLIFALATF